MGGVISKQAKGEIMDNRLKYYFKEELIGQKFGDLVVLSQGDDKIYSNGKFARTIRCVCTCGYCNEEIRDVVARRLLTKKISGCGRKQHVELFKKMRENKYDITGEFGIGYTKNGHKFIFDLEDYEKIRPYKWNMSNEFDYPKTNAFKDGVKTTLKIHKLITGTDSTKIVDHANRLKYDNRKENLRIADCQQNIMNRVNGKNKYIGVHPTKFGTYRAYLMITLNGEKNTFRKTFKTEEEALVFRLSLEARFFKEFSPQRDLFEKYNIKIDSLLEVNND